MTFDEVWAKVEGLPETAKDQVPRALSAKTKSKLSRKSPDEIKEIVEVAINEVNHGSITPLDELTGKRL